jgi:phytoene dehydrogenase-like protein
LTFFAAPLIENNNTVNKYDAIIIGAGHNGLVAAAYLAKAGKKVLVLERRPNSGGIVATEEVFPGFKYTTGAHLCGGFSRTIIEELDLKRHGLEILPLNPLLFAPLSDGNSLLIPRDDRNIRDEIGRFSKGDASRFDAFCALVKKLAGFLRVLNSLPLPDHVSPQGVPIPALIKLAWKFHRLGKNEMREFLRVLPMSIADFLNEWFETEALKAAIASSGIFGTFYGPRAQGTSFVFLHHQLGESNGAFRTAGLVRGGIGNLSQSIARAAQSNGAEIRTGVEVIKIATTNGSATGVVLANGDEITADIVVSAADVKRTFLKLVEPTYLDPHFLLQVKNIRSRGSLAKINFALDKLPQFKAFPSHASASHHGGIIHIGPNLDYLERASDHAKYGRFSTEPFLEITVPSVADPSLAPAGKHVMSVWMQYAPYHLKNGTWDSQREALGDLVAKVLEEYAPGFKNSILHRQILTPLDLEQVFGLTEGHIYHAEIALDQIFFMRPVPGWARYRTAISKLFLCGSGTHPGGGISGLPGHYAAKEILTSWSRGQ